jgi:hypothetical protein
MNDIIAGYSYTAIRCPQSNLNTRRSKNAYLPVCALCRARVAEELLRRRGARGRQAWGEVQSQGDLNERARGERMAKGNSTSLRNHQPFEPETARNRAAVFEAVCDKLGLASCDHKAAQTVAKIIIELEQRGVREPGMLRKMTAKLFRESREAAAFTQCEAHGATKMKRPLLVNARARPVRDCRREWRTDSDLPV